MKRKPGRPRKDEEEQDEPKPAGVRPLPPRPRRHPSDSPLDEALIDELAGHLAKGMTRTQAAALVGISRTRLAEWVTRGHADLEANDLSMYARLAVELDRARVWYERQLIEWGDASALDRNLNPVWVKWRLAHSNAEFREGGGKPAGGAAEGGGGAFETVTPAEAVASMAVKLDRFLAAIEGADGG